MNSRQGSLNDFQKVRYIWGGEYICMYEVDWGTEVYKDADK